MALNFEPLRSRVTLRDIDDLEPDTVSGQRAFAGVVAGFVFGVPFVLLLITFAIDPSRENLEVLGVLAAGCALIAFVIALSINVYLIAKWRARVRLSRFAAANGLIYQYDEPANEYPAARFRPGTAMRRTYRDRIMPLNNRRAEFGNYRSMTTKGSDSTTFGYLAIKLDRPLPHLILTPRSGLPRWWTMQLVTEFRNSRLGLEGDFDEYFTLWVPQDYEADALYVLTPDLMAQLIDRVARYSVEIIDDWMFIYPAHTFALTDERELQRLFSIIETVAPEAIAQTDNYRDDRVAVSERGTAVGRQGRRLQSGLSWGFVVVLGVLVVGILAALVFVPR